MTRCKWCNHYNPDVSHANYCEMCGKPLKKREHEYHPEVEQARYLMLKKKKERDNMDWRDLV